MIRSRTIPEGIEVIKIDSIDKEKISIEVKEKTGFEFFSLVVKPSTPVAKSVSHVVDNYGQEWKGVYHDNHFWEQDPILQYTYSAHKDRVVWGGKLFKPESKLWMAAQEYGLRSGVSFLTSVSGSPFMEVFSISSHEEKSIKNSEISHLRDVVMSISDKLMELNVAKKLDGYSTFHRHVPLSVREVDILRYSADGMTSAEISGRLYITQSTVNFHMKNLIEKLRCRNKTQAVAKAVSQGYI